MKTTSASGRVVEVNWRATHINTGSGLEIIPNSVLAGQAFSNLSRPAGGHTITVDVKFAGTDAPDAVCTLLSETALDLPQVHPDGRPVANADFQHRLHGEHPAALPADGVAAQSTFRRWLWYASRRAGLRLDNLEDDFSTRPGAPRRCARSPRSCGRAARNWKPAAQGRTSCATDPTR